MQALKIFLFTPQHFFWQEVDSEKVHNKPRALTPVITRRLKGISVCLSLFVLTSQLKHYGHRTMPHSLIYLYSLCSSEVHFSKRGNWHFYISYGWQTLFLSLIVWKCFLETQMRRKQINLSFTLEFPERGTMNEGLTPRPGGQQYYFTCATELGDITVLSTPS